MKIIKECKGYKYWTDCGYEYDCEYETDISCEDCICCYGFYDPETGNKVNFIKRFLIRILWYKNEYRQNKNKKVSDKGLFNGK